MDIRIRHLQSNQQVEFLAQQIMVRLSNEYDVIIEDKGGRNQHIHIEYDPDYSDVKGAY